MNGYPGYTLHQIAPYIGKIRPSLARELVSRYSKRGDWVWDPFSGSGTIPLECRLLSRHVIAADLNPYACALTRAKLHAPASESIGLRQLNRAADSLRNRPKEKVQEIPKWVRNFFHHRTLREAKALMNEFVGRRQFFNIGCLLGILHHQRPGFLSHPASHLVPYLRDRLYPREQYPEAYEYRNPLPRLRAKIRRVLKEQVPPCVTRFKVFQKSVLDQYLIEASIDAVITSPPYMNALDYARDNRLRLWFLGVDDYKVVKEKEIGNISTFNEEMEIALHVISEVVKPRGACVLVLGDVRRSGKTHDAARMISELVSTRIRSLRLEHRWDEVLPDDRRSRRTGRATRRETILVFRREK